MDVRSYEGGQDQKVNNKRDNESWGNHKERTGKKVEVYRHVMRREEHYVGRRANVMKVQGRRKKGRPKRRWLDKVKDDIRENGLSADDVYDRTIWRRMSSSYIDTT